MSAIYFHIPFCKRLCGYCDFFKSVKLQHLDATLDAMERETVEQREFLTDDNIQTIYFGGGTPSLVPPPRLAALIDLVKCHYTTSQLREVTLEVNPDDLTPDYLLAVRAAGVNRLSIGVQSFNDDELRFMNRRHTSSQAIEAVRAAQSVGFDNITIDLIFGVDGFGQEHLRRSLDTALSLDVQHISAYHLTIEGGTNFARKLNRGELHVVSEEVSEAEYMLVEKVLTEAGFDHYEVSNYAKSGFRSIHNSSYWHGVHYLGIGPGAHSFNGVQRRKVCSSIEGYLDEGAAGRYDVEVLSEVDHYNEFVMTSLRCCEGIDLRELDRRFANHLSEYACRAAESWLSSGKMHREGGRLFIPSDYFLLSDLIIESMFYCEV